MSSRARNFRRRGDDGDAAAEDDDKPTPSVSKPKITPKQTPKPKPKSSLLSFADDEEQEEDALAPPPQQKTKKPSKPSSASHKISSSKDRHVSSGQTLLPSNVQPQAGTYTKEALLELQKNTRTLARPSNKAAAASASTSEPKIVLKGLIKPTIAPRKSDQEDEDEDDKETTRLASSMEGIAIKGKESGRNAHSYPDQAMIDKIRAERERKRQSGALAPSFIPLDSTEGTATAADELSDEEPEFRERIPMLGTATGKKKGVFEDEDVELDSGYGFMKKNVVVEHSVMDGDDDDEEDLDRIWEEEQLGKALGGRPSDGRVAASAGAAIAHMPQQPRTVANAYGPMPPASIGGAIGVLTPGLDDMSISQKAERAKRAMQENFLRLKESHGRTLTSLAKTDENLSASLLNITALEKSLSAAGEKFIFMQKLRDFVSVMCDFLQHKAPYIEELEEQMQQLHKDHASAVIERRTADNDDEMMELEAAVNAARSVFSQRGTSTAMIAIATSSAEAAVTALKEETNLPVKLDDFGRDLNLQKRLDRKRRAEARQLRKALFESKRLSSMEINGPNQKIEGESSTDESDSENAAYESSRESLIQIAEKIFSDAAEEYSQLSVVKERFEHWKRNYSSSYRDAYMSLSVPAMFSPYVKLELLKWDPLHENKDFFDMKWHSLLFNYGQHEDGSDLSSNDADANLIPLLVEEVALPILHYELQYCWDVLSTEETKNAVSATSLVINYVDPSSKKLAELLATVCDRLADAVANTKVPTWSPLELKAVPNAARVAAYRFGVSVRLMRNICLWKEILALPVLEKLALDELLCRKLLPHVQSIASNVHDAVTRTERIVNSLAGVWSGPSVTRNHSHKLQPLVDFVMSLGKNIEKRRGTDESSGLARRLKKMLVELNEYDNARDVTRAFHLKEAL